MINIFEQRKTEEDPEKHFLLSLLPQIRLLTEDQKTQLYIDILNSIQRLKGSSNASSFNQTPIANDYSTQSHHNIYNVPPHYPSQTDSIPTLNHHYKVNTQWPISVTHVNKINPYSSSGIQTHSTSQIVSVPIENSYYNPNSQSPSVSSTLSNINYQNTFNIPTKYSSPSTSILTSHHYKPNIPSGSPTQTTHVNKINNYNTSALQELSTSQTASIPTKNVYYNSNSQSPQ